MYEVKECYFIILNFYTEELLQLFLQGSAVEKNCFR